MITLIRFIALAIVASASAAFANTPPPPPPEPARLALAERLVAALPLESAIGYGFVIQGLTAEVAANAVFWFDQQPQKTQDETLKSVFYEMVRTESHAKLSAAIGDARASLIDRYARQLSEHELKSAERFALTDEGKAFLLVQLKGDVGLHRLVSRYMYEHISPEFPRILQVS